MLWARHDKLHPSTDRPRRTRHARPRFWPVMAARISWLPFARLAKWPPGFESRYSFLGSIVGRVGRKLVLDAVAQDGEPGCLLPIKAVFFPKACLHLHDAVRRNCGPSSAREFYDITHAKV